jgi:putative membrane protein
MKKLKLLCVAFATSLLIFSCESRKQESAAGTGANEGLATTTSNDDLSDDKDDAIDMAEDANDRKFESDSAERHSDFLVEAAEGGLFEVEAARLAQEKAVSPKVKTFAKHMMDEHSKANKELKALAAKKTVTIPSALGEDKKEKIEKLRKLSGNDFDKEYMDMMVKDHKEDVQLFDKESKGSDDNEVEKWAATVLPKLQKHLEMAQQTQDEVEKLTPNTARK